MTAPCENVSLGICAQRRLRSDYAGTQSGGLHSQDTTESMESKCLDETLRMRGMNLNRCILHMFDDNFSLTAAQFCVVHKSNMSAQYISSFILWVDFFFSFRKTEPWNRHSP